MVYNVYPSSGHALGGYRITFNGSGFAIDAWTYECVFKCGSSSARALVELDNSNSLSQISCRLPLWLFPPCISTVSLLQDSSKIYNLAALTFKFTAGWAKFDPPKARSAGGTQIVVTGAGFNATSSYKCVFASAYRNFSSPAVFSTCTSLFCLSPPWPLRPNNSTANFSQVLQNTSYALKAKCPFLRCQNFCFLLDLYHTGLTGFA